jgi:hypothetical protein
VLITIDIAPYIAEIQKLMGIVSERAKSSGVTNGILRVDQLDILLDGALSLATNLERDIYKEVLRKEGKSYDYDSNEMDLLALGVIFSSWSSWIFKAKSEDPSREAESREQAKAVSKYIESMIVNAIRGGQNIGKDNGSPEGKSEPINIA